MTLQAGATRDVLIQTEALEAATAFYCDTLGFKPFEQSGKMVGLELGAFRLFLDRAPAYGPVFEFLVDDLMIAKRLLVAAGCTIENDDPAVPRCYVRDPYGLIFNVAQRV